MDSELEIESANSNGKKMLSLFVLGVLYVLSVGPIVYFYTKFPTVFDSVGGMLESFYSPIEALKDRAPFLLIDSYVDWWKDLAR